MVEDCGQVRCGTETSGGWPDGTGRLILWSIALLVGGVVMAVRGVAVPVGSYGVVAVGAVFAWWPLKGKIEVVQAVVTLYLATVVLNECWLVKMKFALGQNEVAAGCGLMFMLAAFVAVAIGGWRELRDCNVMAGGGAAVLVLGLHLAGLYGLLLWFYGFGFEYDGRVTGQVLVTLLVMVAMWPTVRERFCRRWLAGEILLMVVVLCGLR